MPSNRSNTAPGHPWHARQKRESFEYSLGYFATLEEAQAAEDAFTANWPKAINNRGKNQRGTCTATDTSSTDGISRHDSNDVDEPNDDGTQC